MPLVYAALFIVGFLALMGLIVYLGYLAEKKRTEALRAVADELGFEFHPGGDKVLQGWLDDFHLFSRGHSKKLANVLRGRTRDLDVAVFDYKYTVGSGKNARTYRTSVACFTAAGMNLPEFGLRPADFWLRLGVSVFGYQDINFDSHPHFSKYYILRGPDEGAIREVFIPEVLDHFDAEPGLSTEAAGDVLLVYRHAHRIDPTQVRTFLEDGFAVLALFRPPPDKPEGEP
jgi:hypothetical protein